MYRNPRPRSSPQRLFAALAIVLAARAGGVLVIGEGRGHTIRNAGSDDDDDEHDDAESPRAVHGRKAHADVRRRHSTDATARQRPRRAAARTLETIVEYPAAGAADPGRELSDAAPIAGRFPIVVYVHGFSAHADNPYLHPWAAAGFVAIAPKFPLSNTDTPGGPTLADTVNEPADVSFVISRMLHLGGGDADLRRVIDPSAVGVMGESLGAGVAIDVGYDSSVRDPRIKAVVPVSGGCTTCASSELDPEGSYFTGTPPPILLIHGTADPALPYQGSVLQFERARTPKFLLTLIGAGHVQYGPPWEPIAIRATIDFFRGYLEHDTAALDRLATDADVPGTASLRSSGS